MERGPALSPFTSSRPGRLLAVAAWVLGFTAFSVVVGTLALLAADGHPEGLLAAGFGAVLPVVLWGVWRLRQRMHVRTAAASHVSPQEQRGPVDQKPTAMAEVTVIRLKVPAPVLPSTSTTLVVPVSA